MDRPLPSDHPYIWVIDHSPVVLSIVPHWLAWEGYDTLGFLDGHQLDSWINQHQSGLRAPDLILIDLQFPDISRVFTLLQQQPACSRSIWIGVTEPPGAVVSKRFNLAHWIEKPISIEPLLATLAQALAFPRT